ncbi:MerR family transcriptional regulator [Sphingomicrobium arenosum]|uniref:hypothetical protein n=1 Tax=Sphingomicrobium arenosum TaxID=2233861 RepID=UPI0022406485|nr:hypothetical protein [Sphingomicrobium arenosum]
MTQLPLFDVQPELTARGACPGGGQGEGMKSEDDVQSSEEKEMSEGLSATITTAHDVPHYVTAWPMGLTYDQALAYTSASPSQMRRWQQDGRVVFHRVGRNGRRVAYRPHLDALLEERFKGATRIEEDFDFG